MSRTVEVSEIVDALYELGGEALAKGIKAHIEARRGEIPPQYRTSRTFHQAIQKMINLYCPQSKNYRGSPYFIRIARGRYRLNKPVETFENVNGQEVNGDSHAPAQELTPEVRKQALKLLKELGIKIPGVC
jgi:hypothetical protein